MVTVAMSKIYQNCIEETKLYFIEIVVDRNRVEKKKKKLNCKTLYYSFMQTLMANKTLIKSCIKVDRIKTFKNYTSRRLKGILCIIAIVN